MSPRDLADARYSAPLFRAPRMTFVDGSADDGNLLGDALVLERREGWVPVPYLISVATVRQADPAEVVTPYRIRLVWEHSNLGQWAPIFDGIAQFFLLQSAIIWPPMHLGGDEPWVLRAWTFDDETVTRKRLLAAWQYIPRDTSEPIPPRGFQ